MATLFTSKDPVVRLIVLIYFKLGKAEGVTAMIPLSLHGEGRRGSAFFFTLTFFFFFYSVFPLSFRTIWGPGSFSHLPIWSPGLSLSRSEGVV